MAAACGPGRGIQDPWGPCPARRGSVRASLCLVYFPPKVNGSRQQAGGSPAPPPSAPSTPLPFLSHRSTQGLRGGHESGRGCCVSTGASAGTTAPGCGRARPAPAVTPRRPHPSGRSGLRPPRKGARAGRASSPPAPTRLRAAVRWARRGAGAAVEPPHFPVPQMPTSPAGSGDGGWGVGRWEGLGRAREPGSRRRGPGRPPEPRSRPEGWPPPTVHGQAGGGSPRRGGRSGSSGGVDRTDQLCRAATSGSPATSGGGPSREKTVTGRASRGVAVATARAPRRVAYGTWQQQTLTRER